MSVETSVNDRPGALPKIYLGMIFDSSAEGVELKAELNTDLDSLKASVKRAVDQSNNSSDFNSEDFAWSGNTYYPFDRDVAYGGFYWAKIQEVHPGMMFSISDYA